MQDITTLRKKIDKIDTDLIDLISQRLKVAQEIGKMKEKEGLPVYNPKREQEVLERLDLIAKEKYLDPQALRKIYVDIMYAAKKGQVGKQSRMKLKTFSNSKVHVAFQGVSGAYSEIAAQKIFPNGLLTGYESFERVFEALLTKKADVAVVPVENSTYGSVLPVYEHLMDMDVVAVTELQLPIEHCLLGIKGAKITDIHTAYSHYQALGQCKNTLEKMGILTKEYFDTAGAAKFISEQENKGFGAVASEMAAGKYGLLVLKKGINDNSNNITRFLAFVRSDYQLLFPRGSLSKTSVVFSVPHVPGAIHTILGILTKYDANLTKIESRPSQETNWEYIFYIDFVMDSGTEKEVLNELRSKTQWLRWLGTYKVSTKR